MKRIKIRLMKSTLFLLFFLFPLNAFCDAPRYGALPTATPALDPRLPPVIPGEKMNRGGNEMKVWSSAGPVYGNPPPEAPSAGGNNQRIPPNVIIDNRQKY